MSVTCPAALRTSVLGFICGAKFYSQSRYKDMHEREDAQPEEKSIVSMAMLASEIEPMSGCGITAIYTDPGLGTNAQLAGNDRS